MLHWQRVGDGPHVVLVHGFLGSTKIFEPLTEYLSKNFCVTAIDLPGSAGSFDIPVPSTVEELSLLVADTIRESGVSTYSILGHSLGAMIALEISLQLPDVLEKMVQYGGCPDGYLPKRFESTQDSIDKIHTEGFHVVAGKIAAKWFRNGDKDPLYPLAIQAGSHCNENAAIEHLKTWDHWKAAERLQTVKTKTLIICGDSDQSTHPDLSIEMWHKIPNSQLFIAPNAGHIVHLERIDMFNEVVGKFLLE